MLYKALTSLLFKHSNFIKIVMSKFKFNEIIKC